MGPTALDPLRSACPGYARVALAALPILAGPPIFASGSDPVLVDDGSERSVRTWAAPGMLQNPVAIGFDPLGNLYIAESDRAGKAVLDTRSLGHLRAVEEDLQFRSVEDRRAQIARWIAAGHFKPDDFTGTEDRVRVLADTDGDGVADRSEVFAGGFNGQLDGIAAGVLWLDGALYFTCIPDLWALRDTDGDLKADERTSLSHGYGVRWCFYGHDLHGLTPGPDGRIYFSLGDRGYNVTTREGTNLVGPDRGAVFRCWPDGSGLELYHDGLRNPQELAFDELGDLFTGDNNCDSGDRARVVQVVEGGDSGWRQDVQSLPSRGPWNRESMWKTSDQVSGPARPAWALPPIAHVGAGPSGLALYPGTGESHDYDGRLFMVDFYGSGATIHAFRCVPDGAAYKLADHVQYYKGETITDIAWGADGRLYMSDWGGGWSPNPNGKILALTNTTVHADEAERAAIDEVASIIRAGFSRRSEPELLGMLRHRDQRVRLSAQYELAKRGGAPVPALAALAADHDAPIVARAHAVWGLGQIARNLPDAAAGLMPLLDDPDAEVRTQALRTLGDLPSDESAALQATCIQRLRDPSPRVRAAAATALGKVGSASAIAPLLELLASNDSTDPIVRHTAAHALSRLGQADAIVEAAAPRGAAVRLGAVLALRKLSSPRLAEFLRDADASVAIEAARAVYDLRLEAGLPALAALIESDLPDDRAIEPLLRRAIEANVLLGTPECAARLAECAARPGVDAAWRRLALDRLYAWDKPLEREGVWGNWADLPARPADDVRAAVRPRIDAILAAAADDEPLLARAYQLQVRHALALTTDETIVHAADPARPAVYRLALLDQIAAESPETTAHAAEALLGPAARAEGPLRRRALELLARADASKAVTILRRELAEGDLSARQHAVKLLASIDTPRARAAIELLVRRLALGGLDPSIALDVYTAALTLPAESPARKQAEALGAQNQRRKGYATALLIAGGDPAAGRELFLHHTAAECLRCHTIDGQGGTAGPDLSRAGLRLGAAGLAESLVDPAATIAPGYGTVSAMPDMTGLLSPAEIRDVVAYISTLRGPEPDAMTTAAAQPARPGRLLGFAMLLPLGAMVWRGVTRRT